ncbi:hypothetical protein Cgig2_028544 [Carnegiea gigantea]|uniref:protein-serine/threonine phosphatase n=1 Tax=Carnegiea gigantea TaxID=171969 RepID=A0A9Q1Q7X9_9CARY|nr:hypothetical protein Cgig2_028544 [Carnegiea gigantea]
MGSDVKLKVDGGEEGEISDAETVAEIGKDEFKTWKQQQQSSKTSSTPSDSSNNNRYWMRDLYKYSYPRGYGAASGLYNLAWAQAVQNKPLNEVLVELKEDDDAQEKNNNNDDNDDDVTKAAGVTDETGAENANEEVEVESEREEGELEEGEINLDSEEECIDSGSGFETEDGELEKQVSSIRKVLDNVTVTEAHKSFDIVCARLKSSLESLSELNLPFLAAYLCNELQYFAFYVRTEERGWVDSPINLVEAMMASVSPLSDSLKPKSREKQEELPFKDKAILTDSNTLTVNTGDSSSDYLKKIGWDSCVSLSEKKNTNTLSDALKGLHANVKSKNSFGLLLDLHKVHDEDSLPSPTSKTIPPFPSFDSAVSRVVHGVQSSGVHPYETDALKAVSSYQQKFGRSTFLSKDRLPSPTPSEDGNEAAADDANDEVSSCAAYNDTRNMNPYVLPQPNVSSSLDTTSFPAQPLVNGTGGVPLSAVSGIPSRGSAKSRDPRLRHINLSSGLLDLSFCPSPVVSTSSNVDPVGDMMNPKKTKTPEGPVLDGPSLKWQRTGLETKEMPINVNKAQPLPASIGLESAGIVGPQVASRGLLGPATEPRRAGSDTVSSGISNTNPHMLASTIAQSAMNVNTTASLQSLLKDIAGNPAIWMNILKEQQKSTEPLQGFSHPANLNSILGAVPLPDMVSGSSSGAGQTSAGLLQVPQIAVTSAQDELATIRMKPRDPRRILHTNTVQKTSSSAPEQRKHVVSALRPEEVVAGRPQSQSTWGDVEHLFEGYDDKQKAAIQQERARRIDEQKKMFAARKLCLVLDLDHTLLNSAKFTEVDPQHDEILRKKEEQDREKPRRHLFRFPHMGMWTKLRPGIWNFLEKFGLPGPSLLEIDHDERPEDGTLASSLAVIERIHQNFFGHKSLDDVDVRNILAAEQRKILAGCRIVFSRVFPVGEANPHLHPLWQTAEQFGAVCTTQIDEQVTHVVANSLGTDKGGQAIDALVGCSFHTTEGGIEKSLPVAVLPLCAESLGKGMD